MRPLLEKVSEAMKEQNLMEPPRRWATDHFKWLIYYQIPPERKTIKELSQGFGKDRKTVREGITDIATLIGLSLEPILEKTWRARAGRPTKK